MRKTALVAGIVLTSMIFIGVLFRILHIPGSTPFLVLGIGSVMVFFLPMLLIHRIKNDTTTFQRATTVFGCIVSWLFLLPGFLFAFQRWPGGIFFLFIGIPLGLIFLALFFISRNKAGNPVSPREPFSIIIVALFAILFTGRFFVREASFDKLKLSIEAYSSALQQHDSMRQANTNAYLKIANDTSDTAVAHLAEKLHYATSDVLQYINELRGDIVGAAVGIDSKYGDTLSARFIERPDDYDTPTMFFIGSDPANVTGKSKELKAVLNNYFKENYSPEKTKKVKPDDVYSEEHAKLISWEWHNFYHRGMMEVLTTLKKIQTDILALEKEALENKEFYSPQ